MATEGNKIAFTALLNPRQAEAVRLHVYGGTPLPASAEKMCLTEKAFGRLLTEAYEIALAYEDKHGSGTVDMTPLPDAILQLSVGNEDKLPIRPIDRGGYVQNLIPPGMARRLWESGLGVGQIAAELGCTPKTASKALKRDGVKTRRGRHRLQFIDPRTLDAIGKKRP